LWSIINRVIIAGHCRLLSARKLGLTEVPVRVADNLTPAQVKAYRLMDNRSHDETSWDFELLGPELLDLQNLGFGNLELTGFDGQEIADFLAGARSPGQECWLGHGRGNRHRAIFSSDRLMSFAVFAESWLILSMLPEKEAVFAFRSIVSVPTVTLMAVMDRFESLPGFPEICYGPYCRKKG
jgi:hypothetical protein